MAEPQGIPTATHSPLRGLARWLGTQRWLLRAAPSIVFIERVLRWLTANRVGLGELGGVTIGQLTVAGRKTGILRTNPVYYTTHFGGFLITGSNWGRSWHPAWSSNLLAATHATMTVRGTAFRVRVHHIAGAQREQLWPLLVDAWPGFALEAGIAHDRPFRLFFLEPES